MLKLEVRAEAKRDLADVYDFSVETFGPVVADIYMEGFRTCFERLVENPHLGPRFEGASDLLHSLSHRSHRIYCSFDAERVVIVRVFHKVRDVSSMLS
jgi:plasmid stabilization system protein ParE